MKTQFALFNFRNLGKCTTVLCDGNREQYGRTSDILENEIKQAYKDKTFHYYNTLKSTFFSSKISTKQQLNMLNIFGFSYVSQETKNLLEKLIFLQGQASLRQKVTSTICHFATRATSFQLPKIHHFAKSVNLSKKRHFVKKNDAFWQSDAFLSEPCGEETLKRSESYFFFISHENYDSRNLTKS